MDLVGTLLLVAGSAFTLLATVGLHRFDSVFARMHAASKSSTFGLGLILSGAALRLLDAGAIAKLVLVGLLALLTIPAGVHLIARSAWRAGTELGEGTELDDLTRRRLDHHRSAPDA